MATTIQAVDPETYATIEGVNTAAEIAKQQAGGVFAGAGLGMLIGVTIFLIIIGSIASAFSNKIPAVMFFLAAFGVGGATIYKKMKSEKVKPA